MISLSVPQQPQPQRPQTAAPCLSPSCGIQPPQQHKPIIKGLLKRERTFHNETAWRNSVQNETALNQKAIERSDTHIYASKRADPLTNIRKVLRTLSNAEAFKYMRQCRLTVAKLKKCWVDVNEEVKALSKNKEYLESALEHIRKDLITNKEMVEGRQHRTEGEPVRFII